MTKINSENLIKIVESFVEDNNLALNVEINATTNIQSFGIDSLHITFLAIILAKKFDLDLADLSLFEWSTVDKIVTNLKSL